MKTHPILAPIACLALLCAGLHAADVSVNITPAPNPATVNPGLFGLFHEEHWGDITPGIWEQYVINPSFEPWYERLVGEGMKTREPFRRPREGSGTAASHETAFPWQRTGAGGVLSLDSTPGNFINSAQSQKITATVVNSVIGIRQTLALPHARRKDGDPDYGRYYELRFWAKRAGNITEVRANITNSGSSTTLLNTANILNQISTAPEGGWVTVKIDLGSSYRSATGGRLAGDDTHGSIYGKARLVIDCRSATGSGELWIDQVTLIPYDAIGFQTGGKGYAFNPDTVANMRDKLKPAFLRWPGGNFTSTYDWRDGVGPRDERPSRPNHAWGGMTANEVGTDEFVEFCRLIGAKVVIGAASNDGTPAVSFSSGTFWGTSGGTGTWTPPAGLYNITPQELGDWVEYCNAASGTLADLRTANVNANTGGSSAVAPYNIELWGVGNEVYGSYQAGYDSNVASYIAKLKARAQEMKSRPSEIPIKIAASAMGVHNEFREDGPVGWTAQILARDDLCKIGQVIPGQSLVDYLDAHHYVYGAEANEVATAPTPPDKLSPDDARRAIFGSTQYLEVIYDDIRTLISGSCSNPGIKLLHLEWGVLPNAIGDGLDHARYDTFVNGIATAAHLNAFIRNADLVHGGAWHNFSLNFQPVNDNGGHFYPPHPRTDIAKLYAERTAGKNPLDVSVTGSPVYDITATPPLDDEIGNLVAVPEIDAVATTNSGTTEIDVMLINRSLTVSHTLALAIPNSFSIVTGSSSGTRYHPAEGATGWERQAWRAWDGNSFLTATHTTSPATLEWGASTVNKLEIPPLQLVHLKLAVIPAGAPHIITHPQNTSTYRGGNATFTVEAEGTNLVYQWKHSGTFLSVANSSTLTLANVQEADALGSYTVVVGNILGTVESDPATLTILLDWPAIITQPESRTLIIGTPHTLTVVAENAATYQWRKNGANIAGATSATLVLSGQADDNGVYDVLIANAQDDTITSNPATIAFVPPPPSITAQPQAPATSQYGQPVTLSVTAIGSGDLEYQWRRDGIAIPGATSPTLELSGKPADAGVYDIVIKNAGGLGDTITSNPVTVIITPDPDSPFTQPAAILIDANNQLYIADTSRHIVQTILGRSGTNYAVTLAGTDGKPGFYDDLDLLASFNAPSALAIRSGTLYIADTGNNAIRARPLVGVSGTALSAANVTTVFRSDNTDPGKNLNTPRSLLLDTDGNIYVADTGNHVIRKITPSGEIATLAGNLGQSGTTDGASARFNAPSGLALAYIASGSTFAPFSLYIADTGNHAIRELRLDTGAVTTLAGSPGNTGSDDGIGSVARFNHPASLAFSPDGKLHVADTGNSLIRCIDPGDGTVTTLAGFPGIDDIPGIPGFKDAKGTGAWFNHPASVAFAPDGKLYVADTENHAIRIINVPDAAVTTYEALTPQPPPPAITPEMPSDSTGSTAGGGASSWIFLTALGTLALVRRYSTTRR